MGELPPVFPSTSFYAQKLTATTYLLIEDDAYAEQPHIYITVYPSLILITDTGTAHPRLPSSSTSSATTTTTRITSLRTYLETYPLPANGYVPLNPPGADQKPYLILFTHCHYDHILGLGDFLPDSDATSELQKQGADVPVKIIASSNDPGFILDDLPTTSLCKYLDLTPPTYTPDIWATHLQYLSSPFPTSLPSSSSSSPFPLPLRIQTLHTPGHTPDSLLYHDLDSHILYVGDAFYTLNRYPPSRRKIEGLPDNKGNIIFPPVGADLVSYMSSLAMLGEYVRFWNGRLRDQQLEQREREREQGRQLESDEVGRGKGGEENEKQGKRITIAAGHLTIDADAERMIGEVQELFWSIIEERLKPVGSLVIRGVVMDVWLSEEGVGEFEFGVTAPREIVKRARKHFGAKRL